MIFIMFQYKFADRERIIIAKSRFARKRWHTDNTDGMDVHRFTRRQGFLLLTGLLLFGLLDTHR
jgi:hypothetical protein